MANAKLFLSRRDSTRDSSASDTTIRSEDTGRFDILVANFKQSVPPCLIMCRSQAFVSCAGRNGTETEYSYYLLSNCTVLSRPPPF